MIIVFLSVMPTYQRRKRDDECNAIDFSLFGIINFSIIISLSPLNNWPMCNNNNTRTLNYIASCLTFIILTKAQDPIGYKKDDIMIHPHSRWWHLLCFLGGSVSIYFDEWLWCVFTFLLVLFDSSIQAHTHTHTHTHTHSIPSNRIALVFNDVYIICYSSLSDHQSTHDDTIYITKIAENNPMHANGIHACMHALCCVVLCCVVSFAQHCWCCIFVLNRIESNRIESNCMVMMMVIMVVGKKEKKAVFSKSSWCCCCCCCCVRARDDWCIPINVCRNSWPRRETLDFWSSYHFLGCLSAATTQTTTTHYKSLLLHSRLSHRITPHHTLPCNVATQFELYTSYIIHLIGLNRIQSNSHYCYSSHRGTYLTTVAEAATSIAAMTSGFRNQAYHKPLSSGKS